MSLLINKSNSWRYTSERKRIETDHHRMPLSILGGIGCKVTLSQYQHDRGIVHPTSYDSTTGAGGTLQGDAHSTLCWRSLNVIRIPGDRNGDTRKGAHCGKECSYVSRARSCCRF